MPGFDLKQLLPLYDEIGYLKYGGTLNFPQLMKLMEPVRLGQEDFGLKHLEIIKRDHLFPAWWKMPDLSPQEIDSLKELFKKVQAKDTGLIQQLFEIFLKLLFLLFVHDNLHMIYIIIHHLKLLLLLP